MNQRETQKHATRERILEAAGQRLRSEGLRGAAIATVMRDADLTHGAFYAHFPNKDALAIAALSHSLANNRKRWVGDEQLGKDENWPQRFLRLAKRYLRKKHRDDWTNSCAIGALAGESARSGPAFQAAFTEELKRSLNAICQRDFDTADKTTQQQSLAFLALCVGGISLARAVGSDELSDHILRACRKQAAQLATSDKEAP